MNRKLASYGLAPGLARQQSLLLRAVMASIHPQSLVTTIHEIGSSDQREDSVAHEMCHYLQMISTPLGLHVTILTWNSVLSLMRQVSSSAARGVAELRIPLTVQYIRQSDLGRFTKEGVEAAVALRRYLDTIFVVDELATLEPVVEAQYGAILGEFFRVQVSCLSQLGASVGSVPSDLQVRDLGPSPFLPILNEVRVTGRDVLENAATAGAVSFEANPAGSSICEYLQVVLEAKPYRYGYLLRAFSQVAPDGTRAADFLVGFSALCDIALFGCFVPQIFSSKTPDLRWPDLHPGWRIYKLYRVLEDHPDLQMRLFTLSLQQCCVTCDELCLRAGWPTFSSIIEDIDTASLDSVSAPFSWIISEFKAALAQRRKRGNFLLPPLVQGLADLHDALMEFDPNQGSRFGDFAIGQLEEATLPSRFGLPLVVDSGSVGMIGDSPEAQAYARIFYYATHFVERIVFHDDLRYPFPILKAEKVNSLFTQMTGFRPNQVFIDQGEDLV